MRTQIVFLYVLSWTITFNAWAGLPSETPPSRPKPISDSPSPGCRPVEDGPVTAMTYNAENQYSNFGGPNLVSASQSAKDRCADALVNTREYCLNKLETMSIGNSYVSETTNRNATDAIQQLEASEVNMRNAFSDCQKAYQRSNNLCIEVYSKVDSAHRRYQEKLARPEFCEVGTSKNADAARNLSEAMDLAAQASRLYYRQKDKFDQTIGQIQTKKIELSSIERATANAP